MRIAIVDDIMSERENLRERLNAQLARLSLDTMIFDFASGADFLSAAGKERFDLVFLDIYMKDENGVDTAEMLRRFDTDCLLVFTTTSTDHALDGFRVRAFHYLVKPYTDSDLSTLFDEIIKRFPAEDRYIEVNTTDGIVRLHFQEILYAEHYQHRIHIYRTGGQETITRQTFREFTASLTDGRFFLCSRGVIVNLEYVEDFDNMNFILNNGKRIAVSRSLAKAARLAFGDFLFGRRA
ncbi:MAG: LytTR family DNA-binding domain-containing protein [Lachnospiraceae bacterium]|nr:LytTR family DNA-binding domain-containing protein [Lachnospiraceae bacterium]